MHILVLDLSLTGHHSVYIEKIVEGYLESQNIVTISVLESNRKNSLFSKLSNRYGGLIFFHIVDDSRYKKVLDTGFGVIGKSIAFRSLFGDIYDNVNKSKKVEYVFMPYIDYLLYAIGLLGSPFSEAIWGGICMRPSFHYAEYGVIAPASKYAFLKKYLFFNVFNKKTLKAIYTIDALLYDYMKKKNNCCDGKIIYFPDPVICQRLYTYNNARKKLGLADYVNVLLVYGHIDKRKGIDVLIKGLSDEAISVYNHLLVVGKQSNDVKDYLQSSFCELLYKQERIHVIDEFVDHDIEELVFSAADIVWLGYKMHYTMSGVMILAGLYGKPVLACEEGVIGWYTNKYELGEVFNVNDTENVLEKLLSIDKLKKKHINTDIFKANNWPNAIKCLMFYDRK